MASLVPLALGIGGAAQDPAQLLAGRYYKQFPDALVTGEKYTGEDIVEIVPVAASAAYVKIHLDYYNGHSCDIFGVAQADNDALIYRDPQRQYDGKTCVLAVKRAGQSLSIDDNGGSCSGYCGARGTLSGVRLPYSSKRPIRYMAKLKASDDYHTALEEWRTGKAQP